MADQPLQALDLRRQVVRRLLRSQTTSPSHPRAEAGNSNTPSKSTSTTAIPIDQILVNPQQPRTVWNAGHIRELAASIEANGMISPVIVEREAGAFILVDGERRLRAAQLLKWTHIEAVVRDPIAHGGHDRLIKALVANLQRADLTPIEQARAFAALRAELGSAKAVARKLGMKPTTVTLRLALLKTPEPVQQMFATGQLALDCGLILGVAKLPPAKQIRLTALAVARGWHTKKITETAERWLKSKGHRPRVKTGWSAWEIHLAGHFDALALAPDREHLPARVTRTARVTCQACSLYPGASPTVCQHCPLADFLRRYQTADSDDGCQPQAETRQHGFTERVKA